MHDDVDRKTSDHLSTVDHHNIQLLRSHMAKTGRTAIVIGVYPHLHV